MANSLDAPESLPSLAASVDIRPRGTQDTTVDLSVLNRDSVGFPFSLYVGHRGKLPSSKKINFANNVQKMWDHKTGIENVSPATKKTAQSIVDDYASSPKDTKDITDFVSNIGEVANESHAAIDFPKLCKKLKLSDDKCEALDEVSATISGEHLAAYGMTEIFGSSHDFNYVMLDTLLQNAGENYINSIPAFGDTYMSFGFYQFTSMAVRHDNTVEGASVVSLYSEQKIPGSVSKLRGNDHHRAAYYFATYNLGLLIKKLSPNAIEHLRDGDCETSQITSYIAVAHHNPAGGRKGAKSWIEGGCKIKIEYFYKGRLRKYAINTNEHFKLLTKGN